MQVLLSGCDTSFRHLRWPKDGRVCGRCVIGNPGRQARLIDVNLGCPHKNIRLYLVELSGSVVIMLESTLLRDDNRDRASRHGSIRQMWRLGKSVIGRKGGTTGIPQEEVPGTSTHGCTWWSLSRLVPDERPSRHAVLHRYLAANGSSSVDSE